MTKWRAVPILVAVSCGGGCEQRRAVDMDAGSAGTVCGAVVDTVEGNATFLLFNDVQISAKKSRAEALGPQISIWKPVTWQPGAKLRVAFLDGDAAVKDEVLSVAREWTHGLTLEFVESHDPAAELRVTFRGRGVWSKVGKQAASVKVGEPTMGLGALPQETNPSIRRAYILHEFGHALGALHEHRRPDAPLTWKKKIVYAHYLKEYAWSEEQVDAQVIMPFTYHSVVSSPQFDRASVMMYPVLKDFTEEGFTQPWNSTLTEWDRSVVAALYK